jgi:F0F1-type ATP synthase membrane subunit a
MASTPISPRIEASASIQRMLTEVTGASGEQYVPLVGTVVLFILLANLISVFPLIAAPTADINTPFALATVVFFSSAQAIAEFSK